MCVCACVFVCVCLSPFCVCVKRSILATFSRSLYSLSVIVLGLLLSMVRLECLKGQVGKPCDRGS